MNAKTSSCSRTGLHPFLGLWLIGICILGPTYGLTQCLPHTISSIQGGSASTLYACAADGKADNLSFLKSDTSTLKYGFIVADGSDNILFIQRTSTVNFDGITPAAFRVWGIVYTDSILYKAGSDVSTIQAFKGCALLSDNVITVLRDIPTSEDASLINGVRDTTICFLNNRPDTLFFKPPARKSSNQAFLVTRFDGSIVDYFKETKYRIDFLPQDVYLIYNLYYTGTLTISPNISNISNAILSTGCYAVGARPVRLDLNTVKGGTLKALTLQTAFCPNIPNNLFFVNNNDGEGSALALILTDGNNICQRIAIGNNINLSFLPIGNYNLRALNFSGKLQISVGDTVGPGIIRNYSNDCYAWASGTINLDLYTPEAGNVVTSTGDTVLFACPGDHLPDRFFFSAINKSEASYAILIVDDKNKIIGVTGPGGFFDFEGTSLGTSKVYGMSFTGNLLAAPDSTLNSKLSTDCFDLTENYIRVIKGVIKGGTVSLLDGSSRYYVCPEKNGPRRIFLSRKSNSLSLYQYVLTTDSGTILSFITNDSISFATLSFSSMRIYGVAYSGQKLANVGNNLFVSSFSDGCYSISDNFIQVVHVSPRGGGVRLPDGSNKELFCPGDPAKRILQLRNVDISNDPYLFVITDSTLKVLDMTSNFSYSFDSLPLGQYYVYGVSYTGVPIINKGSTLDLSKFSSDCFSYSSNRIEVVIGQIEGGSLTTLEGTNIITCPGNLDQDIIQIIPQNIRALGYRYILTNDQNIILGYSSSDMIDFGLGPINSIFRVYGVAYKGDFIGAVNRDIFQTAFSSQCYDLTSNYIRVRELLVPAQRITSSLKDSVVTICVGDSKADTIRVGSTDTSDFKKVFLGIENGKIIKIYNTNTLEFERDSTGIITLYSLVYTGKLLVTIGTNFSPGLLFSDDCYTLSPNSFVIDKVRQGSFCVIVGTKDEQWVRDIKLFPNPAADHSVRLEWSLKSSNHLMKESILTISDIQGRPIKQIKLKTQASNSIEIPLEEFTEGIYTITVQSGTAMFVRKLVINPTR
jgi:hypothetical protein